jgi:excisionase family DNA binding protein
MAGRKSDFTLTKLDDLFSTQEQRDEEKLSKIRDIPLTEIDDFPDHPFKVRDDEDIQHILKVSRTTVYELLKSKKFHSVRVGGQYRISKKSFENWLNGEEGGSEDGIC